MYLYCIERYEIGMQPVETYGSIRANELEVWGVGYWNWSDN